MAAVLRWLRSDLPLQSPSYPLRKTAERQEQARIDTNTRQRLGKADREGRESIPEIDFAFSGTHGENYGQSGGYLRRKSLHIHCVVCSLSLSLSLSVCPDSLRG